MTNPAFVEKTMGRPKIIDKRICSNCHSDKSRTKQGREIWSVFGQGYLCDRCNTRIFRNPKRSRETIKKYNSRQLIFKRKHVYVKENPRKGVCSWCGAIKGINCKATNIHHTQYHDDDVLKDTIELCASCHGKESERIRRLVKMTAAVS